MAINTQQAIDLIALALTDVELIKALHYHERMYAETLRAAHLEIVAGLRKAIDNTYGDRAYQKYCETGRLPSQQ